MKTPVYHRKPDRQLGRWCEELAGAYEEIDRLSRRRFLKLGAAALGGLAAASAGGLLLPSTAHADDAVKTGQFIFPRLQFAVYDESPDRWNAGPIGDVILKKKLSELTNINVSQEPKVVRLADFDDMAKHPFVFMTSEGYFRLAPEEEKNLREFLERGGFIFADDCVLNAKEDRFFQTYVKLLSKLFPENPMRKIPFDHEIFHIYFDFKDGAPHMQGVPHGAHGVFERGTGRLMTIATPGDIHCGWMCRFWSMEKNMSAIKMGINIIIFFLSH
jgi:hypothetical protein